MNFQVGIKSVFLFLGIVTFGDGLGIANDAYAEPMIALDPAMTTALADESKPLNCGDNKVKYIVETSPSNGDKMYVEGTGKDMTIETWTNTGDGYKIRCHKCVDGLPQASVGGC